MSDLKGSTASPVTAVSNTTRLLASDGGSDAVATALQMQTFLSAKGADVASAATVTLGDGEFFHITGTTTITAMAFTNSWDGRRCRVVFTGSLLLTYNAASLILPGKASIQTQPGDSAMFVIDGAGVMRCMTYERADGLQNTAPSNVAVTTQSPAASTTTYLTNSDITIPANSLRVKTIITWVVTLTKTAAGTTAPVFIAKIGTAGTTADTSACSWTFNIGTAVADTARVDIELAVVGPLGSSCVTRGHATMTHSAASGTGWNTSPIQTVTAPTVVNINSTTATRIGLALTLGASYVVTINSVSIETLNL